MAVSASVPELLAAAVAERPDQVYAEGDAGPLTIAGLDRRVGEVAELLAEAGVRAGMRVAMTLPNHADHAAAVFALSRLRATWVALNPRLRGDSLRQQLVDSDPSALIGPAQRLPEMEKAWEGPGRPILVGWTGAGFEVEGRGSDSGPGAEEVTGDRAAVLMYTSGTTGSPKGVQVTERMWQGAAHGALIVSGAEAGDRLLLWEPLCHIGGAQVLLLPLLRAVTILIADGFHATNFWQEARRRRVTHIHHLGGILQILAGQPSSPADREHSVRVAWGGGCDPVTWRTVVSRFGVEVRECYGMTEISSIVTVNRLGPDHGVGRPLPDFEIKVLDAAGNALPPGEIGEIVVGDRGAGLLTPGYFRRPEATSAARRGDRWWTGDRGRWDADGCLEFLGRAGDNIRRRGENVSASHLEQVIAGHPAVSEAAVVGVDSDLADQEILLFVVPADPARPPDPGELLRWSRERLADYETPRYVKVIPALPKTPSERVAKGSLARSLDDAYDAAGEPRGGRP